VKSLGAAGVGFLAPAVSRADTGLQVAGKEVEIQLTPVSAHTFRITVQPIQDGQLAAIPDDGTLLRTNFGAPAAKLRGAAKSQSVKVGDLRVKFSPDPLTFAIETTKGETVQHIQIDRQTGVISTVAGICRYGYDGDDKPATRAMLHAPEAVVFDAQDNLYVSDTMNHRVRRVDATTHNISTVGGHCGTSGPSGDGGIATVNYRPDRLGA